MKSIFSFINSFFEKKQDVVKLYNYDNNLQVIDNDDVKEEKDIIEEENSLKKEENKEENNVKQTQTDIQDVKLEKEEEYTSFFSNEINSEEIFEKIKLDTINELLDYEEEEKVYDNYEENDSSDSE